jgi:hypothetical protein
MVWVGDQEDERFQSGPRSFAQRRPCYATKRIMSLLFQSFRKPGRSIAYTLLHPRPLSLMASPLVAILCPASASTTSIRRLPSAGLQLRTIARTPSGSAPQVQATTTGTEIEKQPLGSGYSWPAAGEGRDLPRMLAEDGSNAHSLTVPQNKAEYVLSTLDKVVNWGRTGSMWPMTCTFPPLFPFRASPSHPPRPLSRSGPVLGYLILSQDANGFPIWLIP